LWLLAQACLYGFAFCGPLAFAETPAYGPYKINFEYAPSYYRYEEKVYNEDTGQQDIFMSLTSSPIVHGFTMDVRRYIDHDWYAQSLISLVIGNVNYYSSRTGYVNGEDNLIFLFDNNIHYCQHNRVCGSIGYALRYLDNDSSLSVTSTGNVGYERENFLHLIPLGLSYKHNLFLPEVNAVTMQAKYYWLLDGWQISHISRFGCSRDLKNKQNTGYGVEASLRMYVPNSTWFYGASFQYWSIDASDVVTVPCFGSLNVGSEPENQTYMFSLLLGYHYQ